MYCCWRLGEGFGNLCDSDDLWKWEGMFGGWWGVYRAEMGVWERDDCFLLWASVLFCFGFLVLTYYY